LSIEADPQASQASTSSDKVVQISRADVEAFAHQH
jgi:hypothetical protein